MDVDYREEKHIKNLKVYLDTNNWHECLKSKLPYYVGEGCIHNPKMLSLPHIPAAAVLTGLHLSLWWREESPVL